MMVFKNIFRKKQTASLENIQSDFVSLSSHQLRTPLSAIKWYAEMLLSQKQGKLNDKQLLYLQQISRSNERAINLVNDLLDVSRIQEGQIHLELRPAKVEAVVEESLDHFQNLIKDKNITINFEIVNGPLPAIVTDREKLKRIIGNVLGNAIHYTLPGGRVRITLEKDHSQLTLAIADSGVGIPAASQPRVFERFFRGGNAIKLAPDGTGLGLFISKSLLDAMGGQIAFQSRAGQGTTFYLKLPVKS